MFIHFLQTKEWKTYEEQEGKTTFLENGEDFSYLAIKNKTKVGPYLNLPYGPSLKSDPDKPAVAKTALKHALESLKTLAKKENCIFIRLEPTVPFSESDLKQFSLIKSKDIDPAHTWILRLDDKTEEEILHGYSQGTRTRYNQFSKKGLSIEVSHNQEDIKELTRMQQALAKQKGIVAYEEEHLRKELEQPFASLYLVHYNDPETKKDLIIGASLFFDDQKNSTRYYMQSAADLNYRKLPATAGLLTSAIFDAKKKGLKKFDFWGVAPENAPPDHPWAGFTAFKKSFGGEQVNYAGTYDLPLNKFKYSLYKKLRSINRKIKKL